MMAHDYIAHLITACGAEHKPVAMPGDRPNMEIVRLLTRSRLPLSDSDPIQLMYRRFELVDWDGHQRIAKYREVI